jgi:hypothetical protein
MDSSRYRDAFKKFMEQKWKDALNVAAGEPGGWEARGGRAKRSPAERAAGLTQKAITAPRSASVAVVDVTTRRGSVDSSIPLDAGKNMQRPPARTSGTSVQRPKKRFWQVASCAHSVLDTLLTLSVLAKVQHPSWLVCKIPKFRGQHVKSFHEMMTGMELTVNTGM